ncbi:MAG: hypothetical protein AAF639_38085, partial [Chloroflexota bacterium]
MRSKSSRKLKHSTMLKMVLVAFFTLCLIMGGGGDFAFTQTGHAASATHAHGGCEPISSNQIYRYVEGIDECLMPMESSEFEELTDTFASGLLHKGILPDSLAALDEAIREELGLVSTIYVVGEGGQVPLEVADREASRYLRYTVTWGENENDAQIMASTLAPITGANEFELLAFDENTLEYNYYFLGPQLEEYRDGEDSPHAWIFKGYTSMAQDEATMNEGCFRCHHNGLPIMRELEAPWANWHSQHGVIASVTVPGEIASEPYFLLRRGAEVLEGVVRGSQQRYFQAWMDQRTEQEDQMTHLHEVDRMLRHLTTNTTVNFKSSSVQNVPAYAGLPGGDNVIGVPPQDTFLSDTIFETVLGIDYTPLSVALPRDLYDAYLEENNFRVEGTESFGSGPVTYVDEGSTYYAFYVPQLAAEDTYMAQLLLQEGVVSEKFVAAMLMVDYANPLFSEKRAGLQAYVDAVTEGMITDGESSVPADVAAEIEASGAEACGEGAFDDCSAEEQFLYVWNLPDDSWKDAVAEMLQSHVDSVAELSDEELVSHVMDWSVAQRDRLLETPRLCHFVEVSPHFPKSDNAQHTGCASHGEGEAEAEADEGMADAADAEEEAEVAFTYSTPGGVVEYDDEEKQAAFNHVWHKEVDRLTKRALGNDPWNLSTQLGEGMLYFDPTVTPIPEDAPVLALPWSVYPNRIKYYYPDSTREDFWSYADDSPPDVSIDGYGYDWHRDWQDEYGEWSVRRNGEGKITRIQFTTESREYWYALWDFDPEKVLELYRELASEDVALEDLYLRDDNGEPVIDPQTGRPAYDDFNQWNGQEGGQAVHMIARFNIVFAGAMLLGAQSTIMREAEDGTPIIDPIQILNCSWHGTPNRNSDPFLSSFISDLARSAGVQLTLQDPVGIYLQEPNFSMYQLPDNAPEGAHPSDYWTVVRGQARANGGTYDQIVHAVYEVPEDQGFTVGDIMINGFPIEYGAQMAETVNIALAGAAMPAPHPPVSRLCTGDGTLPFPEFLREEALLSVAERSKLIM